MVQFKKILCPFDFSENAKEALQYANHLMLKDEDAILYLAHVVDSRVFDYGGPIYGQEPSVSMVVLDQSTREQLEKKLLAEIPKVIQNRVETIILFGVPFLEIINTAKDKNIDLIVIGTHGRTDIAHMLIGSVAEKVVRKAPCPVLSVKSKK
ncbi:MAG: universal stress protein [Candidatus Scalindua sp.]|jgi:nucleotide-binding universal stress UspA family protein|nr:universal stress protein [Candidatus Scalindua sp.]MDV5167159.1 universal stress protein [Candidatus Scalindua sp.]